MINNSSGCGICGSHNRSVFSVGKVSYWECGDCGAVLMKPEFRLSPEKQKERYLKHENSTENKGYVKFLKSFIDPVLKYFKDGKSCIKNILDYGCGPDPVLLSILQSYKAEGLLSPDSTIRGWDPFFSPDTPFYEGGADLVTCLEVAEHFEEPAEDFSKLFSCVKSGGFVAVGTMLLPDGGREAFKSWWYRSDATHVTFYTEKALRHMAYENGLEWVSALSERSFLFRKS
ncbi:MAG: class I SAM-dependent methyltransferase [Treponemataceae bacterium]|nr:class I SAM-dependent methyltransferase [Treponemataceae bacterium]